MTKEKIYQELAKALAVKGIDILALLKLQSDIKADLQTKQRPHNIRSSDSNENRQQ